MSAAEPGPRLPSLAGSSLSHTGTRVLCGVALTAFALAGCGVGSEDDAGAPEANARASAAMTVMTTGTDDYCDVPALALDVLAHQPTGDTPAVDDVNWFARPVPHDGDEWIIAFASHDQNYLFDLTNGIRVRIPDRSDAVATPDGRYMTVPSYYTPDSTIRFYPVEPMLAALGGGTDADGLEPAFVHDHPSMKRVYYQSTALVSEEREGDALRSTYRLMFSGTSDQTQFRIVDYLFEHDASTGALHGVTPSDPMTVCPEVQNDLNTPFISKDGRYVAAYTSEQSGNRYSPGASLKIFELTGTDPGRGTTSCDEVVDLGFAAGKADFSFDNSMLAFHLSQGAYLTPFVNGGLPGNTITDVMVARLERDEAGDIVGHSGLQRVSTSLTPGIGSYFPAFFPDGSLFFLSNRVARESTDPKEFDFRVVDPVSRAWRTATLDTPERAALWAELGRIWQRSCVGSLPSDPEGPFPLEDHEVAAQAMALSVPQCQALVRDAQAGEHSGGVDWDALDALCRAIDS
ncbi:MAG: hypothetical protein OEN56_01725 [Gemmatimonadota bacterium]|nr:hypothetical protein [Gemmatimonadota bacterium]